MIEIKRLNFIHNKNIILKDINFKISRGETIGIIGKSGSGKSLLLKVMSNKITSYNGDILYNNMLWWLVVLSFMAY